mmetsp:Transcript_6499/g.8355  ORF Transcript_6499/g.8355 Transcript_6499/m.8355 type:complete len:165 (+) Transcript_6499:1-495(+)
MVLKIVSGGQTGADRAALDASIELGIQIGGWVPSNRWSEDGKLPIARYIGHYETKSGNPAVRTELNVRDSDATLIFSHGPLTGGSALTLKLAQIYNQPLLHINLLEFETDGDVVQLIKDRINMNSPLWTLNVAGPRHSEDPEIYEDVKRVMIGLFCGKKPLILC